VWHFAQFSTQRRRKKTLFMNYTCPTSQTERQLQATALAAFCLVAYTHANGCFHAILPVDFLQSSHSTFRAGLPNGNRTSHEEPLSSPKARLMVPTNQD
jgi:hypothetical protein